MLYVLILVLVEHTLGVLRLMFLRLTRIPVLILVLVEHTLGAAMFATRVAEGGLNPCFSGTYSRSLERGGWPWRIRVLILVLVEHTLGDPRMCRSWLLCWSLNPCFSGTYSRRTKLRQPVAVIPVLILVLVEHTLGDTQYKVMGERKAVLILVLVEHTLGAYFSNYEDAKEYVS